jgi:hypothetical protein
MKATVAALSAFLWARSLLPHIRRRELKVFICAGSGAARARPGPELLRPRLERRHGSRYRAVGGPDDPHACTAPDGRLCALRRSLSLPTTRPITRTLSLGLTHDGTYERAFDNGALDSQWLRAISLGVNLGPESSLTVALRDINGYGGFATQIGNNLAVGYHRRFASGSEVFLNYGSLRRQPSTG